MIRARVITLFWDCVFFFNFGFFLALAIYSFRRWPWLLTSLDNLIGVLACALPFILVGAYALARLTELRWRHS